MTESAHPSGSVHAASRQALKKAIRQIGLISSPMRVLPDFLIIGTKRGGTTSFYFDLIQHPAVVRLFPPPVPGLKSNATKGVHYFDSNYNRGERWYRSYMPTVATHRLVSQSQATTAVCGEASPYYLFHPAAAERAYKCIPHAKIIVLLRDPITRTYSHWKERRRSDAEPLNFLDALGAEPGRLEHERDRLLNDPAYVSYSWEQQSYATQSAYAEPLERWISLFGRNQVFVAASEEYYASPDKVLGDVHGFLGLPRIQNSTGVVRNAAHADPLSPEVHRRLVDRFAEPNQRLAGLIERRLPWM